MPQGPYWRQYGVQTTVPIVLFEIDGVDHRVDAAHAAGDTTITKDEAAEASTDNGFTDEGTGYSLVLTATEMEAARISVYVVDQTGPKAWLDTEVIVETYGNAAAQHAVDLDDSVRAGLTALPAVAADGAGGLPISDAGGLDMDNDANDALVANNLDHLALTATVAADMTAEVADNTILSRALANGDTSAFVPSTDGLQPIRDRGDSAWITATGFALASVVGALADAAAAGDVTTTDTLMQYMKQILNELSGSVGIGTMPAEQAPANGINLFEMLRAAAVDVSTTIPGTITTAQTDLDTITGTGGALIGTDVMDRSGTLDVNAKTITAGAIVAATIANAAIDNATFAADVGSTAYATNIIALAARKAIDDYDGPTKTEMDTGHGLLATPAEVNTQVDAALNTAIPGAPTANSINERIATMDDAYTATRGGYLDELGSGNLPSDVDAILADTNELQGDDVPTLIAALPTAIENADAWGNRSPSDVEDSAPHGSNAQAMARIGGTHRVTLTDDGDDTGTMKVFKADGSTQWGSDGGVTTAASGDVVTGMQDTQT